MLVNTRITCAKQVRAYKFDGFSRICCFVLVLCVLSILILFRSTSINTIVKQKHSNLASKILVYQQTETPKKDLTPPY